MHFFSKLALLIFTGFLANCSGVKPSNAYDTPIQLAEIKKLNQDLSPQQLDHVRSYWNAFDPIGVIEYGVYDEYESYLGFTHMLIEKNVSEAEFLQAITEIVSNIMGMSLIDEDKVHVMYVGLVAKKNARP